MVQIVCVSPHKTLAGKFSRLAGKSFAGPGKVSNVMKIVVNEATKNALFGDSTGAYPYAAGLRYLVDANNEDTPVYVTILSLCQSLLVAF